MSVRIQLRRDTAANWSSTNPTLTQGEPGYETDTGKIKYGDGTTAWNSLAYAPAAAIVDGTIVNADINASAAISDTKLATISSAGKVSNSATTATSANTASAIVARDASGNFSAGTITANLSGNASTVTTNANLTGDVTSVGNATSIAAGVIVDADISASAAISGTKLQAASTTNAGAVQLSESLISTSTTTAATSSALKIVSDAAITALNTADAALPKAGGTITGNLEIGTTGSLTFEGSTADGFETTLAATDPTADRTITLPNVSGTVITTGDTGSVTSTMIADGTIVNADINAAAAISGSKITTATTGAVGVVQLTDSISSTSTTTAATPNSVKSAYDLANAALPKAGGTLTGDVTLNAQSDLRFADSDSSNWVALQAPGTVASNVTWTLPNADGANGQILSTNGSGTLSWATAATGDVTLTGTQTLTNKTLTDPAIIGTILEDVFTITDGAAFEVDPGNGSVQLVTLGASRTPKATNFAAGESVTLMVDDGSAYTLTWTDSTWGTGGVTWTGGSAPTLATTGYSVIQFWKVGTKVYGAYVGAVA